MALRNIVKLSAKYAAVLQKKARKVEKIDTHIHHIFDDMAETMYFYGGVGLAANQVGLLRRLVVVDVGDGLIKLVNPVIIESSGEQTGKEGCLSIPDVWGMVRRPERVIVNALNENNEKIKISAEGFLARVVCHEIDHLNGILFIDKAEPDTIE